MEAGRLQNTRNDRFTSMLTFMCVLVATVCSCGTTAAQRLEGGAGATEPARQSGGLVGGREQATEVYFADMSVCRPSSALAHKAQQGRWRLVGYESEEVSGTMMMAGPMTGAPDVALPLNVKGWHAIYVGYWYPQFCEDSQVRVRVKLTSDPCFITIADNEPDPLSRTTLREAFWKFADLTGEQVIFGGQKNAAPRSSCVAYLKLQPLSEAQVRAIQADWADKSTKIIIASKDGGFVAEATTREDILEEVEVFRNSDVGRIDFAVCYGDLTNYPSKVGANIHEQSFGDYPRKHDKQFVENLRALIGQGLVPYKVAMEHAHSIGIEFYAMIRMGIGTYPAPMDGYGGLIAERPDLRIVARDGTPLPKLSYAFQEVRDRMLGIIREVADDELDGINLCLIRGAPYVGYEKPVAEAFKKRYGLDITSVADDDERLCRLRAGYVTDFMRGVRKIADEVGARRGRPLAVTTTGGAGPFGKLLYFGYDTKTWIEEKLVDEMIAVGIGSALHAPYLRASGIRQVIHVDGRGGPAYWFAVNKMAATGSDGVFVWDMSEKLASHWALLRQLGHTRQVLEGDEVQPAKGSLPVVRRINVKSVGGVDVEHTYRWGGPEGKALIIFTNG